MNREQLKASTRWALTLVGGGILGFVVARGWLTAEAAAAWTKFLTSEAFIGIIVAIVPLVWTWVVNRYPSLVAIVDAIPEVKGVVLKDTDTGVDMANAVPSSTVTVEGTKTAAIIASDVPVAKMPEASANLSSGA